MLCGNKVQRLQSNEAEEQGTPNIKDVFAKQGTARTFAAPESSKSNAISEHRFEFIFADARAALKKAPVPLNTPKHPSTQELVHRGARIHRKKTHAKTTKTATVLAPYKYATSRLSLGYSQRGKKRSVLRATWVHRQRQNFQTKVRRQRNPSKLSTLRLN